MGVSYNPKIVTDGLVLCLDAANKKSYPGSGTTWTDLSGRSNNGTLVNSPTFSTNNNGSLVFDGVNQYGTIPSSSLWSFGTDATFENWLYFSGASFSTNHRIWCVLNNSTSLDIGISVTTGTVFTSGSSGFPGTVDALPRNQWINLVTIFRSGVIEVYFNNVQKSISGTNSGANKTNTGTLYLGQFSGGGNYYFIGNIATYKMYNRALSVAEIQQNFNATRGRYGI